jgi:glycosyltransferase involved in cell wall biosynthesis
MSRKSPRVAVITEAMLKPGGGDRFLETILKNLPDADIYTPIFNREAYQEGDWEFLKSKYSFKTFLSKSSLIRNKKSKIVRKWFLNLYNVIGPVAYETLDLREYDLVLSLSAKMAKGVITDLKTKHINIYITPSGMDWNWDRRKIALEGKGKISRAISAVVTYFFKIWDVASSSRADENYSISWYIARQVKKIYGIETEIIYPVIKRFWFEESDSSSSINDVLPDRFVKQGYFLSLSRLYNYKRVDLAIRACKKLGLNLVIVGDGPEENNLKKLASNNKNIMFTGFVEDKYSKLLYRNARALLFCGEEDFGLTPIESMSQGTPVIGYNKGGICETVIQGETGEFFNNYEELLQIVKGFNKNLYSKNKLIERAKDFSEAEFSKRFNELILNQF